MFCVSCELRFVKIFLVSGQCVFFVRCELRFEKQLRTALFSVTMQHVVVISYQCFGTPIDGTNGLLENIGDIFPLFPA